MGQILIRNLDDAVIQRLKTKAELAGKSLEQSLRELLTEHAPLSPEERLAIIDRIQSRQTRIFPEITKEEIREGLEGTE
jgi:plasmid stability protein